MHEIESWLTEAAAALGVLIRRATPEEARELVRQARAIFVEGDPRVWWLGLKLPFKQFPANQMQLSDVLPSSEGSCWLFPETDANEFGVYEIDARNVESVLQECAYFEYYVLARNLSWLVAESDHSLVFVCERPPA
jgi:hypothetical protein